MKKYSILCLGFALLLILSLFSGRAEAEACEIREVTTPAKEDKNISFICTALEEQETWILDEIVSDHVSEDVVSLTDSGFSYTISDWIDKDTHSYLFFEKHLSEGTRYCAYGYAQSSDGTCFYFELTSSDPLTEKTVDLEITKTFGNSTYNSFRCFRAFRIPPSSTALVT